jgi:C1A family cysteine protease
MNYKFSWKPDVPDQRDYGFAKLSSLKSFSTTSLPPAVNLRKWCTEIENQLYLGSCTSQALVGLMEYNECRAGRGGKLFNHLSRLFVYYNERVIEESVEQDNGAMLRSGIKSLMLCGTCPENLWPHDLRKWKTKPTNACYAAAQPYRISSYYRLNTVEEMKASIANGHPFVFGFCCL